MRARRISVSRFFFLMLVIKMKEIEVLVEVYDDFEKVKEKLKDYNYKGMKKSAFILGLALLITEDWYNYPVPGKVVTQ